MSTRTSVLTDKVLSLLRSSSLSPQDWSYTTAVTLSALNVPHAIPSIYHAALADTKISSTKDEHVPDSHVDSTSQLDISRRVREALTKSVAITGLPKAINALMQLHRSTPEHLQDLPLHTSPTSRPFELIMVPQSAILHRGERFFQATYGKVAARVMGQMDRANEDLGVMARLMYGHNLSNTSILTAKETSLVLIAGLVSQDVNPQLKGHLRGALNNGASLGEVRQFRDLTVEICKLVGMRVAQDDEAGVLGWTEEPATL